MVARYWKYTTAIGETSQGGRQHRQTFYLMEFKFIYSGSSYKAPAMYRWEDIFEQCLDMKLMYNNGKTTMTK
mgnify:CR=1 FL=1